MSTDWDCSFRTDQCDPVSRFFRDRLGWDWPLFLLVTFLLYGPIEKLLIPYLGGYLSLDLEGKVGDWVPDIEALMTGFVEFPFFFAYYLWSACGVAEVFVSLHRNRSFADGDAYRQFVARVSASFGRWWWSAISLGLALAAVALWHFVIWSPDAALPPWFGAGNTPHRVLALVMISCVAYAVGQIVLRELLAVFWLRRLWSELGDQLVVHPYHADDAGGLGGIAHHAFGLSFFMVPLFLFLTFGSLLPSLRGGGESALIPWSPTLTVGWLLFLILLATLLAMLFWPPHRMMEAQRNRKINEISRRLDARLAATEGASGASPEQSAAVLKEIESLKAVRALLFADVPVWPLNTSWRVKLGATSVVSFLTPALNYGWAALLKLLD